MHSTCPRDLRNDEVRLPRCPPPRVYQVISQYALPFPTRATLSNATVDWSDASHQNVHRSIFDTIQPWRHSNLRVSDLRYDAVRPTGDLHHLHGAGRFYGVSASDGRFAGDALHTPERKGERQTERQTDKTAGMLRGCGLACIMSRELGEGRGVGVYPWSRDENLCSC